MQRMVHEDDAVAWLERNTGLAGSSVVTSLPDFTEFPSLELDEWRAWFTRTAGLAMRAASPEGVAIFYQRDIKHEGTWVDKAYLIQKAAETEGLAQLWHKIVMRAPAAQPTFGKPSFSHLLCFSRSLRLDPAQSTADLLPSPGNSSWTRGMGVAVCEAACRFVAERTSTRTLVAPFCGEGALLAVAEKHGLATIGIERSRKRAERAREQSLDFVRPERPR